MHPKDFFVPINLAVIPVESGNPNRQMGGKFGTGKKSKVLGNTPPKGAEATPDQVALDRKYDQVRLAARTLEGFAMEQVKDFLDGASKRPLTPDEVNNFYNLVRAQILSDLVSNFVYQQKGIGLAINGTPEEISGRIGSLTPAEEASFRARVKALGFEEKQINSYLGKKDDEL